MRLFRKGPRDAIPRKSPVSLRLFTVAYVLAAVGIILGIRHNAFTDSIPIHPEHIPVLLPFFSLGYVLIVGTLYLMDRLRKKKSRDR